MDFSSLSLYVMKILFISSFWGIIVLAKLTTHSHRSIIIQDVTTNIDISTQLVFIDHKILFISSVHFLKSYFHRIDPSLVDKVANITAVDIKMNETLHMKYHDKRNGIWEINLNRPIIRGDPEVIHISAIFTHVLKSYPPRVTQHEKHLILFSGPVSLFSPYLILNHTSYVKTGGGAVLTVATPQGFELVSKSPIIFVSRHNTNQDQYVNSVAKIHYEHLNVFLTTKMLLRVIEVSHWGSIAVTETIVLEHSGAKFYGPFHRPLQGKMNGTVLHTIVTFLPSSASDVSIYDDIGRISSVRLTDDINCVIMEFSPRFLLYGGWKVKYTVNYIVPAYEYLYNKGDEFILKMRTIDHIYNDMVVDKVVVKIILPEGSQKINLSTPYLVKHLNDSVHVSYLDTVGRPVISFTKENLVEDHIQDFVLHYQFSKYRMLFEPFYVVVFLELIFTFFIAYNRVDFSISKEDETIADQNNFETSVSITKINKPSCFKPKKKR